MLMTEPEMMEEILEAIKARGEGDDPRTAAFKTALKQNTWGKKIIPFKYDKNISKLKMYYWV